MKIGILGGTFNPPHCGHLTLAQESVQRLGLDKLFLIPTNIPPHKKSNDPGAGHRLQMCKLLVDDDSRFEVLDIEIKRGGVSYSIDTARFLKKQYPDDELYVIVGSDLVPGFGEWKEFENLKKLTTIVVAKRDAYPFQETGQFQEMDITQVDASSTPARMLMFVFGADATENMLPKEVIEYIKQHTLYVGQEWREQKKGDLR